MVPASRSPLPPPARVVRRRRLSEEVAEALRDMILSGELAPGTRMTQDELAVLVGVSTTPVREALLRLGVEGFVQMTPNRSFEVIAVTQEDIRDVYWMTAFLMAELARRACSRHDDELIAELRNHERRYRDAVKAGDTALMHAVNWDFHKAINLGADAPKVVLTLNSALRFIPHNFYEVLPAWQKAAGKGHRAILTAFERGDADAAAQLTAAHMQEAGERLGERFADKGYWTPAKDQVG